MNIYIWNSSSPRIFDIFPFSSTCNPLSFVISTSISKSEKIAPHLPLPLHPPCLPPPSLPPLTLSSPFSDAAPPLWLPPPPPSRVLAFSRTWVTCRRRLLLHRPCPSHLQSSPLDPPPPELDLPRPLALGVRPPPGRCHAGRTSHAIGSSCHVSSGLTTIVSTHSHPGCLQIWVVRRRIRPPRFFSGVGLASATSPPPSRSELRSPPSMGDGPACPRPSRRWPDPCPSCRRPGTLGGFLLTIP
jgi:hypothetical protein